MRFAKLNSDSSLPAKLLYEHSFPIEERRPWASILIKNKTKDFDFFVLQDGGLFVGIISIWQFECFDYIEHFAISEELRGKGLGSEVINIVKQKYNKPFVLEVELPTNLETVKRIRFYERLGFKTLEGLYMQPPYTKDLENVRMNIMTNGEKLSFDYIKQTLYCKVYNRQ